MMNLPNILTLSRIAFAGIMVGLLNQNALWANIAAVIVFAVASITDFYDGYLAKRMGLVSDFGKIMDPIADKVLILAVFAVMANIGMVQWWMVIVIALREVIVTASRLDAMRKGQVLAAEKAGKIKTVVQIVAISLILLYLVAEQSSISASWFYAYQKLWQGVINALMLASVLITVVSGASYFRSLKKI